MQVQDGFQSRSHSHPKHSFVLCCNRVQILEDLDALAGNIAFHHVYGAPLIVTASVDRIRLRQRPAIDQDVHLCGKVTWVGKSSMEIRMQCANLESKDEWWLEAYFTFVTLDPQTNKPVSMPALIPTTPEEKRAVL